MSSDLFNPKKYGFKQPLSNSAFLKKRSKKIYQQSVTNPCDREKLIAGLKAAKEKDYHRLKIYTFK